MEGWSLTLPMETEASSAPDLASLVESYSRLLYRVAYSVVRSSTEAEEVVQEVFVRVLERPGSLASVRDLRVWLIRIAWNLSLDRRRRTRPEQMDAEFAAGLVSNAAPVDQLFDEAEQVRRVLGELDRLPRAEKQVLLLSAVEELGTGEIAGVLGRSESAVRALLFRARSRLRERLGKGGAR